MKYFDTLPRWKKVLAKVIVIVLFLVICSLALLMISKALTKEKESVLEGNKLNSNMLITAAHLGSIDGYKLVYKDEERDTGYYIRNDVKLTTVSLQHVLIDEIGECNIISSYEGGFVVSTVRKDLIRSGLSGVRVKSLDGKDIGFISALLKDGNLDCKTLE